MYEEVKNTVRIGDVLRHYGYFVHDRLSYRIPCPIHKGHDANFSVNERDGLWNCFSVCGRGGSVIDLVAALDNVSIPEAVKKLREEYKLTPFQALTQAARRTSYQVERFKQLQRESPEVALPNCNALEEGYRGLTVTTIQHWGLTRTAEGVLIPLLNNKGKLCSYSVRRDDSKPKYDNAPGTSKCMPFGLYENSSDIIKEGFCWIVEGQLDCINLWQRGHKNVVALMGSSMTERQAMLILAVTSNLMLCLDGDEAGRVAAAKIKKQWQSVFDIGIFELPDGIDPDQYEGILKR